MSDNIFAEIYNKILGLFGQSAAKEESKDTAINRLRLVLMQDRTNLTPEILHRMRSELIEVLSTYVELDKEALELNFEQEGEQMALMLSIPVVRAKEEIEIEEAIKAKEEAKKAQEEQEENEENSSEEDENTVSDEAEKSEEDTENTEDEKDENSDKNFESDGEEDQPSQDLNEEDCNEVTEDTEEFEQSSKKEKKKNKKTE